MTISPPEKIDAPHVEVEQTVPAVTINDDVPEGGYGWVCVVAVG